MAETSSHIQIPPGRAPLTKQLLERFLSRSQERIAAKSNDLLGKNEVIREKIKTCLRDAIYDVKESIHIATDEREIRSEEELRFICKTVQRAIENFLNNIEKIPNGTNLKSALQDITTTVLQEAQNAITNFSLPQYNEPIAEQEIDTPEEAMEEVYPYLLSFFEAVWYQLTENEKLLCKAKGCKKDKHIDQKNEEAYAHQYNQLGNLIVQTFDDLRKSYQEGNHITLATIKQTLYQVLENFGPATGSFKHPHTRGLLQLLHYDLKKQISSWKPKEDLDEFLVYPSLNDSLTTILQSNANISVETANFLKEKFDILEVLKTFITKIIKPLIEKDVPSSSIYKQIYKEAEEHEDQLANLITQFFDQHPDLITTIAKKIGGYGITRQHLSEKIAEEFKEDRHPSETRNLTISTPEVIRDIQILLVPAKTKINDLYSNLLDLDNEQEKDDQQTESSLKAIEEAQKLDLETTDPDEETWKTQTIETASKLLDNNPTTPEQAQTTPVTTKQFFENQLLALTDLHKKQLRKLQEKKQNQQNRDNQKLQILQEAQKRQQNRDSQRLQILAAIQEVQRKELRQLEIILKTLHLEFYP